MDARTQALAQVNERLQGEIAERRAAEATAETRRRETEVLADLARRINASLDLDAVLQVMAECARELAASDMAGIMLREPASGAMTPRYVTGHRPEAGWTRLRIEAGKGLGGQVLLTGRPWRTDDYQADPHFSKDYLDHARAEGIVAAIIVPIPIERGIEGLVYIANRSPRPFGDTDETMLVRLAEHAAIAIRNAQLFREVAHRRETAEHLADASPKAFARCSACRSPSSTVWSRPRGTSWPSAWSAPSVAPSPSSSRSPWARVASAGRFVSAA